MKHIQTLFSISKKFYESKILQIILIGALIILIIQIIIEIHNSKPLEISGGITIDNPTEDTFRMFPKENFNINQ